LAISDIKRFDKSKDAYEDVTKQPVSLLGDMSTELTFLVE